MLADWFGSLIFSKFSNLCHLVTQYISIRLQSFAMPQMSSVGGELFFDLSDARIQKQDSR